MLHICILTVICLSSLLTHELPTTEILSSSLEMKVSVLDKEQQTLRPSRPMATLNHPDLTVSTIPRKKRVRIRVMLIHLGLRLLQATVQSQEKEMEEIGLRLAKPHETGDCCVQRLVSTTTSWIKLLHSTDEPTVRRTTAGRGEVDCV